MGPLHTIYRVMSSCNPNMSFPNSTRFAQFQKFGKKWVGGTVLPSHLRNNFCTGSDVLFMSTCTLDLTFLAPLTSIYMNSFPKLGAGTLISGHKFTIVVQSGTIGFYGYDFLLVINCIRGHILRRFRDSFRHVQRRYIWLPLLRLTLDRGVPLWLSP